MTVDCFRWNPSDLPKEIHRDLTGRILQEAIEKHSVHLVAEQKCAFYQSYSGDPPALVFFDADHSYEATLEDLKWAKGVGAHLIAGHNYSLECPGVMKALEKVFQGPPHAVSGSLFFIDTDGL